ncbi:MAG: pitrilysin family protein [Myxococcota bacterium]|nr:pitrilysin family protein [Myxococcota bacterium]
MKTLRTLLVFALLQACTATQSSKGEANFRATAPAPSGDVSTKAPVPDKEVFANGATLLSHQKSILPLINFSLVLKSGSSNDPLGQSGLAGISAELLRTGTKTRSAKEINEAIEFAGTSLSVSVDKETTTLSFSCLKENFASVLEVVAEIILQPSFSKKELERLRAQRLGSLAQALDNPKALVGRVFRRHLFAQHPYVSSSLGDASALKKFTVKDIKNFYQKWYRPNLAGLILVGDIDAQNLDRVRQTFAGWKANKLVALSPEKPQNPEVKRILVDRSGAPQSALRIGHLGVERSHPDFYNILMCNMILGGLFNSRINMNLREDKGYTYGARTYFDFLSQSGSFFAATSVRTDATAASVNEIFLEIATMHRKGIKAEELEHARNAYTLSFPGYFQTLGGIAQMFGKIFGHALPVVYYRTLPEKINTVQVEDVNRVAREQLKPENLSTVIVGDKEKILEGLESLGRGAFEIRSFEQASSG